MTMDDRPIGHLTGRRALVTGATGGLGPVISRRLREDGATLLLSARNAAVLDALAAEVGGAQTVPADLTEPDEAIRLAAAAGDVDVLIANAGLPANGALLELEVAHIERALAVNLEAVVVLIRALLPHMVEQGSGHIVLLGSLAGLAATPKSSLYNATKFAVRGFGLALRAELRGTGVGASVVSPTFVSGAGMWAETGQRSRQREVSPDQVAEACSHAIRRDRGEVLVAPASQRFMARIATALPGLAAPVLRASAIPDEAITRQRSKR